MRCWKDILKRKTPTIILTSIPVLFMLKQSMSASVGIVIINESCVRSRFTPAPVLLPQKNHRTRRIPPETTLSDCPTARRKHTQWRRPHGCRQCSSDGTAWDQCPDTRRTCSTCVILVWLHRTDLRSIWTISESRMTNKQIRPCAIQRRIAFS